MSKLWTESELASLHAEYLAGARPSELAKRRRRKSADLLFIFQFRGWQLREKTRYILPSRRIPAALINAMHADYQAGLTFAQVERKYQRGEKTIRTIFVNRGLPLRESRPYTLAKNPDGTFAPLIPKTPAEIDAIVAAATKITVPPDLALEWRKWSIQRRGEFIARLRAKIKAPTDRPELPFSENVTPFDYACPVAQEIVRARNAGTDSRTARTKLDIRSQGVIFQGLLYFWVAATRSYQRGIPWTPEFGRPSLHRVIYEQHVGPIPPSGVIIHIDGNPNNVAPANLQLRTKNDLCRENHAAALTRKSRETTALLLKRSQTKTSHDLIDHLQTR